MKKRNGFILIFIIVFLHIIFQCIFISFSADVEFPDIQEHWGKQYVDAVVAMGSISGFEDGLFHPDEYISTENFITMIIKGHYVDPFPSKEDPALPYLKKALEYGVIDGADFDASTLPISRLSAARISYMYLNNIWGEADEENVSVVDQLQDYTCRGSYCGYVEQVYTKGIMIGRPGFLFDGDANLTRAEAATVIRKMLTPSLRTPPANYLK